jgi:crossover junction endodeoxyribonuclease RuvC
MIFAAIDPGSIHAAIALFQDGNPVMADDIRVTNGMLDALALGKALKDMRVDCVVVEDVHAMPKQGVVSTFKFGMGTGIIHGVIGALRLPMTLVSPGKWKNFHGLVQRDKEASRQLARRRWPYLVHNLTRKLDADRAEALLIGDWFYVVHVIPRTRGTPDATNVSLSG